LTPRLPIFIVGVQRSGTTLLRMLLNAHSQVAIPEEARFLMPLLTYANIKRGLDRSAILRLHAYLSTSREFDLWSYDRESFLADLARRDRLGLAEFVHLLYGSYARAQNKAYWGDKSLFFRRIGVLHRILPSATFIHLVRDGRDVFDSWRRFDPIRGNAPTAALDWRLKIGLIESTFARLPPEQLLTVRYEDLLQDPGQVMRSVCTFLGIEFEPSMLEFHRHSNQYIGEHHSKLIFKPIDASNQAKWRLSLSPDEKRTFDLIAGSTLAHHGYKDSGETGTLFERAAILSRLIPGSLAKALETLGDARERRRALANGTATMGIKVGEKPAVTHNGGERPARESARRPLP
jgi:hypothetical protein